MKPAERIELITRCANRLSTGRSWADIDFILSQFQLPTTDYWDPSDPEDEPKFHYVREMLSQGSADPKALQALDDYLGGQPSLDPRDEPWETDRFRLFLTHLAAHKNVALQLKLALAYYGIDTFVAHEDIEPGKEWLRQITAALQSCHALAGLLHEGFRTSDWCDQEVGIVIGRGQPTIPVRIDITPYGFFGAVQAVPGAGRTERAIALDLIDILIKDKRTSARMIEAIVTALIHAHSYDQANALAGFLDDHASLVDADQLSRLRAAQKNNRQVGEAFDVPSALYRIERALSST